MKLLVGAYRELSAELLRERHHRRVQALDCIAFLTYRCTSCCRTCTIWQREGSGVAELTREQWLELVPGLAEPEFKLQVHHLSFEQEIHVVSGS